MILKIFWGLEYFIFIIDISGIKMLHSGFYIWFSIYCIPISTRCIPNSLCYIPNLTRWIPNSTYCIPNSTSCITNFTIELWHCIIVYKNKLYFHRLYTWYNSIRSYVRGANHSSGISYTFLRNPIVFNEILKEPYWESRALF